MLHGFQVQIYNEKGHLSSVLKNFYSPDCQTDAKNLLTNRSRLVNFQKDLSHNYEVEPPYYGGSTDRMYIGFCPDRDSSSVEMMRYRFSPDPDRGQTSDWQAAPKRRCSTANYSVTVGVPCRRHDTRRQAQITPHETECRVGWRMRCGDCVSETRHHPPDRNIVSDDRSVSSTRSKGRDARLAPHCGLTALLWGYWDSVLPAHRP